jgi:hypothetical protein
MDMMWYSKIISDTNLIPDFIAHYNNELIQAKREIIVSGNIEKNLAAMPGNTELRFSQLQEIEAVLNYLNIQLRKLRRKYFQKYLEGYNRALTSRDAEKYVDGEDDVIEFEIHINDVALLRNKFLGIMKGLESKNFMLGHITRLRCAGMEDSTVG